MSSRDLMPAPGNATDLSSPVESWLPEGKFVAGSGSHRLLLRCGNRLVFVEPAEVQWIEANDNYVVFHTTSERLTVRITMQNLENLLSPKVFLRIHRSVIINIEFVRELRPLAHGDYSLILINGVSLTLSRSYRHQASRLMGETTM